MGFEYNHAMRNEIFDSKTRKQLLSLDLVCGFAEFANYMICLGMVYHLSSKFGLDSFMIGIASSINTASYLLFCLLFESQYEKLKPATCIMFSLIGMGASALVLSFTSSVAVFFVMLFVYGAARSMLWPQITGLINREKEGMALSKAQGGFNLSWSLFSGVSPLFSGLILGISTNIVFVVSSGLIFVCIGFLFSSRLTRDAKCDKAEIQEVHMLDHSTNQRFFSWAGLVLVYLVNNATLTVFPLFAQTQLAFSELQTGVLLSIKGLTTSLFFVLLARMKWWKFKKSLIILSKFALLGVCILGQRITGVMSAAVYCFTLGVVFSFIYTVALFNAMSGAVNKSKRMMIHEVILTLGCVAGSSGGGYLYRSMGFADMLWKFFVWILSVVVIEILVMYYMHRNEEATEVSHFNDKDGGNEPKA